MNINRQLELKTLQKRLLEVTSKLKGEKDSQRIISKNISNLQNSKKDIENKIKSIQDNNNELTISEHAIIRYLERVKGINMEDIKNEILTDSLLNTYGILGDGKLAISKNIRAVVKNGNIITIET